MKKRIIFDIDDTVCDLIPELVRTFNNISGTNFTRDDWHSYDIYTMYGITQTEYLKICEDTHILEIAKPIEHAQHTVDTFAKMGFEIIYLTSRGWITNAYDITKDWLDRYNFKYDQIHIVPFHQSKVEYIESNSDLSSRRISAIVDDNAKHVDEFIEHNSANVISLVTQPWNKNYSDLDQYRIKHVIELLDFNWDKL